MPDPVSVTLQQLQQGLDGTTLTQAFGPDSLGIIIVKDLPAKFHQLRLQVLKSISVLATLPKERLDKLQCEESTWLTGWSCGKEVLASTGEPDFNKGSYYVNCAFHRDPRLEGPTPELCDKFQDYKSYTSPNIWPPTDVEGLENFEKDTKELCNLIIEVGQSIAINCDKFMGHQGVYQLDFLERIVKNSTCTKARLLHYFPSDSKDKSSDDDWCGEHVDHSCITGLTSALFLDESKGLLHDLEKSPDPQAGLYIRDRHNNVHQVKIPSDCLAFQTGSALEEVSQGNFKAVPHYVRGTSVSHISRNTLAVFCQPDLDEMVNDKENFAQFATRVIKGNH
ncbi:Clavaminate synthase-like protein [Suhomyces tanzawaensis NRRL Y-17324]|uniref:Clavaminate synthase-like protein n=1 Tax=Suhomyces tanzawaensis NRRL Y-17324 TaxID=984487 RepID=A0A1E4SNI6_9ASCO|nr:Clavaminate synthase-like protein [Suhomyces tanzawaensis NRRL Y-17324]ODV81073.1 Clavaminate synthase-like protein [Suhomyces tanzawaensis NRRL Y-17324]